MNYRQEIEKLLSKLPHELQVKFALCCCNDVKQYMSKESLICLDLVELWLKDKDKVSNNDLWNAAHVAAAYDAVATHAAAAYAAVAAYAANTAVAAASTYAANTAVAAASTYAANTATMNDYDKKIHEYYLMLKRIINELTELEKLIYDIDMEEL